MKKFIFLTTSLLIFSTGTTFGKITLKNHPCYGYDRAIHYMGKTTCVNNSVSKTTSSDSLEQKIYSPASKIINTNGKQNLSILDKK